MPLDIGEQSPSAPDLPEAMLPEVAGDDRELVAALLAVMIVDDAAKVSKEPVIDELHGLQHDFDEPNSLVYGNGVREIVDRYPG